MIVVHFFLREKKDRKTLMLESTATEGLVPLASGVTEAFGVSSANTPQRIVEKAKALVLAEHPELEFVDVLKNETGEKERPLSFDLTFRPRKSLLGKLGLTKK